MNFREVTYAGLSGITHKILLHRHRRHTTPEIKVVRYKGVYRVGCEGRPDAIPICAAFRGAQAAWLTKASILDFRELDYRWGDEMGWAFGLGWNGPAADPHPLAVLVGDKCRDAIQSLIKDEYDLFCRDTMPGATALAREKIAANEQSRKAALQDNAR